MRDQQRGSKGSTSIPAVRHADPRVVVFAVVDAVARHRHQAGFPGCIRHQNIARPPPVRPAPPSGRPRYWIGFSAHISRDRYQPSPSQISSRFRPVSTGPGHRRSDRRCGRHSRSSPGSAGRPHPLAVQKGAVKTLRRQMQQAPRRPSRLKSCATKVPRRPARIAARRDHLGRKCRRASDVPVADCVRICPSRPIQSSSPRVRIASYPVSCTVLRKSFYNFDCLATDFCYVIPDRGIDGRRQRRRPGRAGHDPHRGRRCRGVRRRRLQGPAQRLRRVRRAAHKGRGQHRKAGLPPLCRRPRHARPDLHPRRPSCRDRQPLPARRLPRHRKRDRSRRLQDHGRHRGRPQPDRGRPDRADDRQPHGRAGPGRFPDRRRHAGTLCPPDPYVVVGHHEPAATGYDTVNNDDRLGAGWRSARFSARATATSP